MVLLPPRLGLHNSTIDVVGVDYLPPAVSILNFQITAEETFPRRRVVFC